MKRTLLTGLFFLATNLMKGLRTVTSMGVTKTKMAILYVKAIKVLRLLFISFLGVGACLVFLLVGIVLFHVSIILYAPWSDTVKMWLTLAFASLYVFGSLGLCMYVFSQDHWVKMFNAKDIVDGLAHLEAEEETP